LNQIAHLPRAKNHKKKVCIQNLEASEAALCGAHIVLCTNKLKLER
jgi:hypothetical protein